MRLNKKSNKLLFLSILFLIVLIFPFWKESSNNIYPALVVDEFSVGYYQSTTCNISLFSVIKENFQNDENIYFNNNNYAGLECFGKVTGLDMVNDKFIISIGTNSNGTLLMQSFLWFVVLLGISKKLNLKKINFYFVAILTLFFTFQQFSEQRFYSQVNKYFNLSFEFNNFYLINIVLVIYIIFVFISIFLENNEEEIINYFPFMFLVIGAFNGFNLNFFSMVLSYLGLKSVLTKNYNTKFNLAYLFFIIFWLQTTNESSSYFDTDKLKGFINSSNNYYSKIYWIILFFFIANGFIYLYKVSNINLNLLNRNFLLTANLLILFGIFGALFPFQNFLNYVIFGQNKRGTITLSSVDGNTWRGFSTSAESVGEFYGFVLLFFLILLITKKLEFDYKFIFLILLPIYGVYKTNNFAVVLSFLIISILILLYVYRFKISLSKIYYFVPFLAILISSYLFIEKLGFEYVSSKLLYEASLHSNLFSNLSSEAKSLEITNYFNAREIEALINVDNKDNGSSLLVYLAKLYNQTNFNFPFIPNFVTLVSFISIIINRNEMWGIFIAKYNPSTLEFLFGNGPNQLNNYLYNLKIRLDVPEYKVDSLFLPHSSLLDIFVFFGIVGIAIFLAYNIHIFCQKNVNNEFKYLLLYLLINILKSDSLLYLNSLVLLVFIYILILKKKVVHSENE